LRDEDLRRVYGFHRAGNANFTFYARGIRCSGMGNGRCRTRAGSKEDKESGYGQG
jgi:hypothetical protein